MKMPLKGQNDLDEHVMETNTWLLWEERQARNVLQIFETLGRSMVISRHMISRHHFTLPWS